MPAATTGRFGGSDGLLRNIIFRRDAKTQKGGQVVARSVACAPLLNLTIEHRVYKVGQHRSPA